MNVSINDTYADRCRSVSKKPLTLTTFLFSTIFLLFHVFFQKLILIILSLNSFSLIVSISDVSFLVCYGFL